MLPGARFWRFRHALLAICSFRYLRCTRPGVVHWGTIPPALRDPPPLHREPPLPLSLHREIPPPYTAEFRPPCEIPSPTSRYSPPPYTAGSPTPLYRGIPPLPTPRDPPPPYTAGSPPPLYREIPPPPKHIK